MKKNKAFMAAAIAAAVFMLTGCDPDGLGATFGKDYFFGNWDTGLYSVKADGSYVTADVTDENGEVETVVTYDSKNYETNRIEMYFNGKTSNIFNGGAGTFYQVRTIWNKGTDPNPNTEGEPTEEFSRQTVYFGTYKPYDDSGEKTGRFELHYNYGIAIKDKEGISVNAPSDVKDKLAWAKELATTQGKSKQNGVTRYLVAAISAVDGVEEVLRLLNDGVGVDDKLLNLDEYTYPKADAKSLLKWDKLYTATEKDSYSNNGYTIYVHLDKNSEGELTNKELCGDIEGFTYEFKDAGLIRYNTFVATSDKTDKKCVTINDWLEEVEDGYKVEGCSWGEFNGKEKAVRTFKWTKSAKAEEGEVEMDVVIEALNK